MSDHTAGPVHLPAQGCSVIVECVIFILSLTIAQLSSFSMFSSHYRSWMSLAIFPKIFPDIVMELPKVGLNFVSDRIKFYKHAVTGSIQSWHRRKSEPQYWHNVCKSRIQCLLLPRPHVINKWHFGYPKYISYVLIRILINIMSVINNRPMCI